MKEICACFLSAEGGRPITLRELYEGSVAASDGQHTKRVLITAKDVRRSETLFAVNGGPGADAFGNMPLLDAVMASSVAPIFLEPFKVWIDGGVGSYGNPCYVATVEATEYLMGLRAPRYEPKHDDLAYCHDNVIHFSFGTGMRPNNVREEKTIQNMLFHEWLLYVVSEGQDEANNDQVWLTESHFSRGNNWYSDEFNHQRVDFRRFQLVLDPDILVKPVADGGLGMTLSAVDREMVSGLEMNSHSPEDLEIMGRVGRAWAEAIGENFASPHYPFVERADAYQAPASPVQLTQVPLQQYVNSIYGPRQARA